MSGTPPCTSYALIHGSRHRRLILSYGQSGCAQRVWNLNEDSFHACLPFLHNVVLRASMCERNRLLTIALALCYFVCMYMMRSHLICRPSLWCILCHSGTSRFVVGIALSGRITTWYGLPLRPPSCWTGCACWSRNRRPECNCSRTVTSRRLCGHSEVHWRWGWCRSGLQSSEALESKLDSCLHAQEDGRDLLGEEYISYHDGWWCILCVHQS
jgi:hypothetical protein